MALRRGRPSGSRATSAADGRADQADARLACLPAARAADLPVLTDTAAIAGSASTMPMSESAPGRSPNSSPASTENAAVVTALTELATLKAACRKPRYSAIVPTTPLTPATAAQAMEPADGAWLLANATMGSSRAALITWATIVTRTALVPREASPAA